MSYVYNSKAFFNILENDLKGIDSNNASVLVVCSEKPSLEACGDHSDIPFTIKEVKFTKKVFERIFKSKSSIVVFKNVPSITMEERMLVVDQMMERDGVKDNILTIISDDIDACAWAAAFFMSKHYVNYHEAQMEQSDITTYSGIKMKLVSFLF